MRTAWRLTKTKHLPHAFDGEGPRLYGGRWSSPGRRVVYVSESLALAVLEVLVHLQDAAILPAYSTIRVTFDDAFVIPVNRSSLPRVDTPQWIKPSLTPSRTKDAVRYGLVPAGRTMRGSRYDAGISATSSSPSLVALFLSAEGQVAEGATQPQSDRELGCGDAVLKDGQCPG